MTNMASSSGSLVPAIKFSRQQKSSMLTRSLNLISICAVFCANGVKKLSQAFVVDCASKYILVWFSAFSRAFCGNIHGNISDITARWKRFLKLHYLENHLVPFIKKWKVGSGILSEHGGESVHSLFKQRAACFASMPARFRWVEAMMRCHLVQAIPATKAPREPAKQKKK